MKKLITATLVIFFVLSLKSQDIFTNFFENQIGYDFCMGMLETGTGKIVAINQTHNFPQVNGGFTGSIPFSSVPNFSFTRLKVFNADGTLDHVLGFPDTDSTFYYGFKIGKLSDGRIVIGGEIAYPQNNNTYDVFIAILNSDATIIENIIPLGFTNNKETFKGMAIKGNDNILVYGIQPNFTPEREFLLEIDTTGLIINQNFNINIGIYDEPNEFNNMLLNNIFFHHVANGVGLVKIDENFNVDTIKTYENFNTLGLGNKGKELNGSYIIAGAKQNVATVYQLQQNDSLYIFFQDTAIYPIGGGLFSSLEYESKQHIYFAYSVYSSGLDNGILVYSIDENSNLNWKKHFTLISDSLEELEGIILQSILATKDNGCLITIGVKDGLGYGDCYALKLDSNGNRIDLLTGLGNNTYNLKASDFMLYLNPVTDKLSVYALNKGLYKIKLYDLSGKLVNQYDFKDEVRLDLNSYVSSGYFYELVNEKGIVLDEGKIVKP